ncbi:peptidase S24-like protein [Sphingomonas sp. BK235]|nr:peptidase S24-like protein [Sphingomonas sp. BK235]
MAEMLDLVPVASIDLAYGMGGTFADGHVSVEVMHFPRQWIEAMTRTPPAALTWARGRGNSMSPTIEDDDIVLIDRSDRSVKDQDAIWAFTIGDIAMMKRLRIRGETVTILSDNDRVPPDKAHPDEINVVGRVSHIIKRL